MQPLQHRAPVALVHDPSSSTVSRTKQLPGDSIVDAAASIGDLASKVMQFAPVPALSVAADLVVCILNTYMQVKELRERSLKFARRAASALIDLGQCMEDKWDLAPQALLDSVAKFQQALASIRDFMNEIASFSWVSRWRSRRYISGTLDEFEGRLDDAARSFQVASLITIQCALDTLPERLSDSIQSSSARGSSLALSIKEDEFGFRKYHQSEIEISHVRRNAVGWFSDTLGGVAYNRKVIVKKYYLPAQKERWWEEVIMLRDLFHENLPQLVGYSDGRTKTPFILLADVHMSEYDLYIRNLAKTATYEVGALNILKAFRDVLSVADYVQRQLSLSAAQVCQFIAEATFAVDCARFRIIVGLPLNPSLSWPVLLSGNSAWDICQYIFYEVTCNNSYNNGFNEKGYYHASDLSCDALAQLGLWKVADDPLPGTDLTKALNLEDVSSLISTHHQAMISRNAHYTRSIPPGTRIGDFGYMSRGRHAAFHRLGNIFDDPAFHGEVTDTPQLYLEILPTLDLETGHLFLIPGPDTVSSDGSACWRIFIPQPSAAEWMHLSLRLAKSVDEAEAVQFMSARGRSLAEQSGIEPEDLVFVYSSHCDIYYWVSCMFDPESTWLLPTPFTPVECEPAAENPCLGPAKLEYDFIVSDLDPSHLGRIKLVLTPDSSCFEGIDVSVDTLNNRGLQFSFMHLYAQDFTD